MHVLLWLSLSSFECLAFYVGLRVCLAFGLGVHASHSPALEVNASHEQSDEAAEEENRNHDGDNNEGVGSQHVQLVEAVPAVALISLRTSLVAHFYSIDYLTALDDQKIAHLHDSSRSSVRISKTGARFAPE